MSFSDLFHLKVNDHTAIHSHKHRQTNMQTHKHTHIDMLAST